MHHARRRDCHLRHHPGMRLQKLEMLEHRMIAETDLAGDMHRARFGFDALELDAMLGVANVDAVEHAEEVEVPPCPAELAIGRELEADFLLLLDDFLNFA